MSSLRRRIIDAQEHAQAEHDNGAGMEAVQSGGRADAFAEVLTWLDQNDPQEWDETTVATIRGRCNVNMDRYLRDARAFEALANRHPRDPAMRMKAESLRDAASVWHVVATWFAEGVPPDLNAACAWTPYTSNTAVTPDRPYWVMLAGRPQPVQAYFSSTARCWASNDPRDESALGTFGVTHVMPVHFPEPPKP